MDSRVLVPVEADEAHLALLLRLGKGFENAIGPVNQFRIIVVDDLVNLPHIEVIGLQTNKRRFQHAHGKVLLAAMRADAAHNDGLVSPSLESNAKTLFTETAEIFPCIVKDVDAVVDRSGNHVVDFSLISDGGKMEAAHAQNRTFQAGLAQGTLWRLEAADLGFVCRLASCSGVVVWNHGGNSCDRGALQEASAAYPRSNFATLLHICASPKPEAMRGR